jgi:hypothetical protein
MICPENGQIASGRKPSRHLDFDHPLSIIAARMWGVMDLHGAGD